MRFKNIINKVLILVVSYCFGMGLAELSLMRWFQISSTGLVCLTALIAWSFWVSKKL